MTDRANGEPADGFSGAVSDGAGHPEGTFGPVRGGYGERSDAALTAAIRAGGDAGAMAELYRRHAPAVLMYARACCRDPHTAEDLAPEVFARTVRTVLDGRGPSTRGAPVS
ncbi:RNA polymerase sigma factor [Streptomyces sp. NPDC005780]|uniref:RNA polymerase sigma factor n=1 Tax=Streptomyces sp. NPDC005780 TaxID=3364730 RepID=UPI0036B4A020